MPFRAESSFAGKAYSARKPFPFHVCTMDADGSGNKRLTESRYKNNQKGNSILTVGYYRSVCCSDILQEGCFLKHQEKGRRQTALPPKNQFYFAASSTQSIAIPKLWNVLARMCLLFMVSMSLLLWPLLSLQSFPFRIVL